MKSKELSKSLFFSNECDQKGKFCWKRIKNILERAISLPFCWNRFFPFWQQTDSEKEQTAKFVVVVVVVGKEMHINVVVSWWEKSESERRERRVGDSEAVYALLAPHSIAAENCGEE